MDTADILHLVSKHFIPQLSWLLALLQHQGAGLTLQAWCCHIWSVRTGAQTQTPFLRVFTTQPTLMWEQLWNAWQGHLHFNDAPPLGPRTGIKQLFPSLRGHCSVGKLLFMMYKLPLEYSVSYFSMSLSSCLLFVCCRCTTVIWLCCYSCEILFRSRLQSLSLLSAQSVARMMVCSWCILYFKWTCFGFSVTFAQPFCGNIRYFKYELRNLFCCRVGILKHVKVFLQIKKVPSNIFLMF